MARRHESLIPLSRDHRDALALAFRLHHPSPPGPATAMTPPSTPASRAAEVLEFFAAHLEGHFRAEEEALFPAIAEHVSAGDPIAALLRELVADHRRLEALRHAIAAASRGGADADGARVGDTGESALDGPLRDFADVLEQHVRREERELFVRFDAIVPEPEAVAVGGRVEEILRARKAAACNIARP